MKELAAKYGISFHQTAGNSPWSNRKCEREHYTADRTIEKCMEEDPSLSLDEAVSHAVYVHNLQITKRGFLPRQLMFGTQGTIPGITDGNPASMEPITESGQFRKHFIQRQLFEDDFRKIDASERIQKALGQKAYGYADEHYDPGGEVLFKEDDKEKWTGPGKVTAMKKIKLFILRINLKIKLLILKEN